MSEGNLTIIDLRMMPLDEVVALYHGLDAPEFEEMHGEYAAALLDQGSRLADWLALMSVNYPGHWLCKAFEPTGANNGHGYNSFRGPTGVFRAARMRTRNGPSKLPGDAGEAFHLEYAKYNNMRSGGLAGAHLHTMFDEVRKVAPGLYLGIGRVGFTQRARAALHPFTLEGPVAPFAE